MARVPLTRPSLPQRRRDQRAHRGRPVAQRRVLGDVAHEQRRAALDGVDRGALVEPEELLLETPVGGAEVGADHEAPGLFVLEAQDRVIRLEHHRGRRRAQAQHLRRIGRGDHAQAGLVDRADLGGARRDARLALRAGDLLRGGGGDLEQRLLDGAPAGRGRARLDREHARERVAGEQRKRGVGEGAVGAAQEGRLALHGHLAVDALAERHAVLAAEPAAFQRARRQLEIAFVGIVEIDVHDAAPGAQRDERAQSSCRRAASGVLAPSRRAHLAHGRVARGLVAQGFVLLGARDDLGVEMRELLAELEVGVGEGVRARRVVQVQDAEHAAVVDQRHAQRRLDVEALAHDVEGLAIRLAAQAQRARVGRDPPGDAFADPHADLRPQLGLDPGRHPHAQLARVGVEQHQRAALGPGHAERDLEHAAEQLVGVDRQVVGLDDLVQRLQQLGLAVARAAAVAPEQARDERRHDLHAALGDFGEARREAARRGWRRPRRTGSRRRRAPRGPRSGAPRASASCRARARASARRTACGVGVEDRAELDVRDSASSPGSSWSASSDAK